MSIQKSVLVGNAGILPARLRQQSKMVDNRQFLRRFAPWQARCLRSRQEIDFLLN
ncbi:MAG: hypothetical protein H0W77_10925 [Acidobacteria bacterium]|nr:hypothetical protein [Acidobacteriota bacterium]